jgi:hypothetical protein
VIDIVLPKSRPTAPITGACVWRPDGDPKRPMCGLLVTSRHSWVCQWHSVAWMPLDKKKRDELKAAAKPKAKDTNGL